MVKGKVSIMCKTLPLDITLKGAPQSIYVYLVVSMKMIGTIGETDYYQSVAEKCLGEIKTTSDVEGGYFQIRSKISRVDLTIDVIDSIKDLRKKLESAREVIFTAEEIDYRF